jgi:hypothetical protein
MCEGALAGISGLTEQYLENLYVNGWGFVAVGGTKPGVIV